MSEFQQYEFLALDRPLTSEEQTEIRKLSSRVELSATQAHFIYHYGNFRGDELKVLESYFDVLVYIANWGTRRVAMRFPRAAIDLDPLKQYASLEEITLTTTSEYVILDINYNDEDGGGMWLDETDRISALAPVRQDILRGDLRALYLAWLKCAPNLAYWSDEYADEEGDEAEGTAVERLIEPQVPPGLKQLSAPLSAFAEFFEIDQDLISAAAEASPSLETTAEPIEEWLALLPLAERDAFLVRVARGDPHAGMELMRRLREVGLPQGGRPAAEETARRSLATLQALAKQHTQRREQRQREAAERARIERLNALAEREPEAWRQVFALIERKQGTPYDEAVALLVELRELAVLRNQTARFAQQFDELVAKYQSRPSLLDRIRKVGLLPKR